MNSADSMSITELRRRLPEVVDGVERTQNRVSITRGGAIVAVLVSPDDLAGLEETLEILDSPETMAALREADAEVERGETVSLDEVRDDLRKRSLDV